MARGFIHDRNTASRAIWTARAQGNDGSVLRFFLERSIEFKQELGDTLYSILKRMTI
jgi:hypothetical protein